MGKLHCVEREILEDSVYISTFGIQTKTMWLWVGVD